MLKSYLPGINTSIFTNIHDENIFSEKLLNELHTCIENQPHVIHPPNLSESLLVRVNGTLVKKQNHILLISVQELHNDMILQIYQEFY